jgi:hypothetical protein
MSANGDISLGATSGTLTLLSPFARKFSISDTEISKEERTCSGKLVKDIIATKKQFRLSYESIDGTELTNIIAKYDLKSELVLRVYSGPSTYTDYTVMMEPISERTRLILRNTGVWENAIITLNEV